MYKHMLTLQEINQEFDLKWSLTFSVHGQKVLSM